jgi:two-component system CheB/CheR fusion protein
MLELLVVGLWVCLVPYSVWFFLSARKRERERVEVHECFVGLYNSSKDAMGFAGFDGTLLDVNDPFCKLTDYSREELLSGRKYQDITPKEYEEYEAKVIEVILATGKPAEYEKEYIRKDGSRVPILLTTFVVNGADGKPMGLAAIIKDITERKKAERAIQEAREYAESIVATVREPLMVLDKGMRVVTANRSFYQAFKVKPEEIEGRLLYAFGDQQWDISKLRQLLEEIIPKNTAFDNFEVEQDFPIIGRRTMLLNARRIYKETNKTQMILLAIEDITERKRLQENLLRSEKLAAIGQLAATVGHELRNPLGVINNSSYFLNRKLKDVADEKVMKHLKIIERKINSANLIISDLLDFARKKPPAFKQTDLNDIVMGALSSIVTSENIKVTTKLGEIPSMLLDQEQITRVFQNMILNAIQAMPEGGKLTIQTSKHDNSAKITFKDTGVGIPEENLPKLFTPLFSTKAKGVGLGLTICKQIVEGHSGNITVKSKVGKGSIFIVRLPIRIKEDIGEGTTIAVGLPVERRVKSAK